MRKFLLARKNVLYKHYKGNLYELITDNAKLEKTDERMVIYKSLITGQIWIRPYDEFFGFVEGGCIVKQPRFKLLKTSDLGEER
ncbi:hypothetical protein XO11_00550 [Marinitoga sp. 1138]|nr:hypothetical protein [Marinitoga sp. 1138]